ncbi:hypothetical protein MTR67_040941 [Solanum verrucosum]|uniref:Uncharacterized protein n=1 Tax=Solanum verrucosum TaxID=315347 RepID=A0AAF0UL95_SOLVR|nr:hypothetical protein MTR67_040941 [Solanum verrucosum]
MLILVTCIYLHHKTMQAKRHQYIECTSMRREN